VFLIHPAQVESVVWIIEQSNLMCATFMLAALLLWIQYLRSSAVGNVTLAFVLFSAALFIRENAAMFPMAALAVAAYFKSRQRIERIPWKVMAAMFTISLLFVVLRFAMLTQMSQSGVLSFGSQLSIVLSSLAFALKMILIPTPITINHLYVGWRSWMSFAALATLALIWFGRKDKSIILIAALFLIFWFPTSHVIAIAAFFAERFLYMPLIAFALLCALWFANRARTKRIIAGTALLVLNGFYLAQTLRVVPLWKSDTALWMNAVQFTPGNWRVWFNLASSEKIEHPAYATDHAVLKRIQSDLTTALRCSLPSTYADDIFLELAKTDLLLGENEQAEEHARRAAVLNPSTAAEWARVKAKLNRTPAP
jgi:hypothetical protein